MSRKHADIYWDDRCFIVEDLGSTNGSTLNDRPLVPSNPVPILDGDRLGFGGFEIIVEVLAPGAFPESNLGGQTRKWNFRPSGS